MSKYYKKCDYTYSSAGALMKHFFTLKHLNNRGVKKDQLLIGARAHQTEQGDEPKCSTAGLTNGLDIAEREYELGFFGRKITE